MRRQTATGGTFSGLGAGLARAARILAQRPAGRQQAPDIERPEVGKQEPAISRVLSRTIIHLRQPSPAAWSNLPGSPLGTGGTLARCSPIWSCSGRGLPCRVLLPVARCALTAPFHPYRLAPAVYFLWHFPWARALQALPGALSEGARTFLRPLARTAIVWPTPAFPDRGFYLNFRPSHGKTVWNLTGSHARRAARRIGAR